LITDERKDELEQLVGYYAGAGPAAFRFMQDYSITNEEAEYIYSIDGLNVDDCVSCGWPDYRDSMSESPDEDGLICQSCESEG
jgi:hypothetical protein